MSTMCALKQDGTVILGADSRCMNSGHTGVLSDGVQKVYEIGPGALLSVSGNLELCRLQVKRARELAGRLGTSDIRPISNSLAMEFLPNVEKLAARLATLEDPHEDIRQKLAGEEPLHGYVACGSLPDGTTGYIGCEYTLRNGRVTFKAEPYFGAARRLYVTRGKVQYLGKDRATWMDDPLTVVGRFLSHLRKSEPAMRRARSDCRSGPTRGGALAHA